MPQNWTTKIRRRVANRVTLSPPTIINIFCYGVIHQKQPTMRAVGREKLLALSLQSVLGLETFPRNLSGGDDCTFLEAIRAEHDLFGGQKLTQ